ncbi:MAG TPA: PQQ-binding-like beta-propeller repeat protein [Phycisphaerae bacterium]|nr:PQQ-binding-like beta-propeller repeat protein [Phycisphaerae bacterium]
MFRLLRLALIFTLVPGLASAQDWPEWRGPGRDGTARGVAAPAAWPEDLQRAWRVEVGLGHSSPVMAGDRIFVHTRDGEAEVVTALDLATGAVVWRQRYDAPYRVNPAARSHGPGPKSTPVVASGLVYTLGISGVLSAFDAASGRLAWRKTFEREYPETAPTYGTAMSPVVEGGLLIAHVGTDRAGALTAFDAATGEVRWRWDGDGPGYASPIVVEIDGTRQVITQSSRAVVGVSAASGALLWRIPITTPYAQNIVTPIVLGNVLIYAGLDNPTTAVRLVRRGEAWRAEAVWQNPDVAFYMSTPVIVGGRLFGLGDRNKGQFVCLDVATGRLLWETRGREGDNAAIVDLGSALLWLTSGAELVVSEKTDDAFRQIRRYTVADSPTWAHPVPTAAGILIKDERSLTLWRAGQ